MHSDEGLTDAGNISFLIFEAKVVTAVISVGPAGKVSFVYS